MLGNSEWNEKLVNDVVDHPRLVDVVSALPFTTEFHVNPGQTEL